MSKISIVCSNPECGIHFDRSVSEVNRNQKLKRKSYCSLACKAKIEIKNSPKMIIGNPNNLVADNRKDEYSPFKRIMLILKMRNKESPEKKTLELTVEQLKELWEKQQGTCPFTGWKLILQTTTKDKLEYVPNRASLDRIDSNKGYSIDNVRFVSLIYQFAKNKFTDKDVYNFCQSFANFNF